MIDNVQNLQRQISQQVTRSAQGFYGNSVGGLKSRVRNDRAQLENLAQQMREGDSKAQVREMIDAYNELERSLDQASQDQGVQQAVSQTLLQARQSANGAAQQAQQTGEGGARATQRTVDEQGYITETTFDENGEVVDENEVGNVADLPVEEEYIDEQGRVVSQVRDEDGNAYELVGDDEGNMIEARTV